LKIENRYNKYPRTVQGKSVLKQKESKQNISKYFVDEKHLPSSLGLINDSTISPIPIKKNQNQFDSDEDNDQTQKSSLINKQLKTKNPFNFHKK
jgi:hypothetical protein